ncbi:MAG: site-2 protease family protein [bacterium]|nr:site-2 protease family protein [bacterium]
MEQATGALVISAFVAVVAVFISLSVHEFSHALAAYLQGDTTAQVAGRLTLNPIAHIDPIGTLLVPGILLLTNAPFLIGWAKPVPFNPYNLRNTRYGPLYVGLAGPASNAILFLCAAFSLKFLLPMFGSENFLIIFLGQLMVINFVLGVFNLVPIAPLDGSKILPSLLGPRYGHITEFLDRYGNTLLLVVLFIDFAIFPFLRRAISTLFVYATSLLGIPLY